MTSADEPPGISFVPDRDGLAAVYGAFERLLAAGSRPSAEVLGRRLEQGLALVRAFLPEQGHVAGAYVLYNLSPSAVEAIEASSLLRGAELTDEHLLQVGDQDCNSQSLYLSTIAAELEHRRALTRDLDLLLSRRHARKIFSRPSTPEGFRYLERRRYEPVSTASQIWCLNALGRP